MLFIFLNESSMRSVSSHKMNLNRWEQQRYAAQKCIEKSWQLIVWFVFYPFIVPYDLGGNT